MDRNKRLRQKMQDEEQRQIIYKNWTFYGIVILWLTIMILFIISQCRAQNPTIVKGYIGNEIRTTQCVSDYDISEDNRTVYFIVNENGNCDTLQYDVKREVPVTIKGRLVRTTYLLSKDAVLCVEPTYDEEEEYLGDYCKMTLKKRGPFDKLVFLFFARS